MGYEKFSEQKFSKGVQVFQNFNFFAFIHKQGNEPDVCCPDTDIYFCYRKSSSYFVNVRFFQEENFQKEYKFFRRLDFEVWT